MPLTVDSNKIKNVANAFNRAHTGTYNQMAGNALKNLETDLQGRPVSAATAVGAGPSGGGGAVGTAYGLARGASNLTFFSGIVATPLMFVGKITGSQWFKDRARDINFGKHAQTTSVNEMAKGGRAVLSKVAARTGVSLDGSPLADLQEKVAPALDQVNGLAGRVKGIQLPDWKVFRWLDNKFIAKGNLNQLAHDRMRQNLGGSLDEYLSAIDKLDAGEAVKEGLRQKASDLKNLVGQESSPANIQSIRDGLKGLTSDLNKVIDSAPRPTLASAGQSIANGLRSLGGTIKNSFTGLFSKGEAAAPTAPTSYSAKDLRAGAEGMLHQTTAMAQKGAATNITGAVDWLKRRGDVVGNMSAQQVITGAMHTGILVYAAKGAVAQGNTALHSLQALEEDISGKKISKWKALFSSDVSDTVKEARKRVNMGTIPNIVANFALYAGTLIFQRRLGLAGIGVQMGGGMLVNGLLKPDFGMNHYVAMAKLHDAGETISPQQYIDMLASMDKQTAKTGKMHGTGSVVSDMAYYCAFNQVPPSEVMKMVDATRKDPMAGEAWAESARQTIAEYNAKQQSAASPSVEPEQTLGQQAAASVALNGGHQAGKQVLGVHTAKAVADEQSRMARGAGAVLA